MAERVFQAGLGTEWERAYKEGSNISTLILAQVIKVNYKFNSVDLMSMGQKNTFQGSHINNGKFSARLPLEFGGRNSLGQPYGQVKPINVGDMVLVGFVNKSKDAPIVLSVYGTPAVSEQLSRTPFESADPKDDTLVRQTNQYFSLYPSLTYDNIDGEGNKTVTFTGKTFFVTSTLDNTNSGLTDGNHGTEYEDLEQSYYASGEEIEPMNPYAPNMLFKHQGLLTQQGTADNHLTLFHIKDDGTFRTSVMDKADDWRTYFEMTPNGGAKLRKQFDSKVIGKALKRSELGISEDGTLFLRNGDTYLEVKEDGIYSNGLNMDVDLSEIQATLDEQGKKIVIMSTSIEKTNEKVAIIAEKTEFMEGEITDFRGELVVMADEISTKVSETQVKDIVDAELGEIVDDVDKIKQENERLNKIMEDIADDGLVTPLEKDTLLREWLIIQDEYPTYILQANDYEIDKKAYEKAYSDLDKYITPILADMETTTAIDPAEFRTKFKNYYDERLKILTGILGKIRDMAVEAMKKASEASIDASNAWREATQAQLDADKANNLISDIASDGKLTPSEKYELKREYDSIVKEYPNVLAQGTKYEVSTADYTAKYTNLINYVKNNRLFDDMGETVAVDGEELRKTFSDYYASKVAMLRSVTDKAKSITDEHAGRIYVAETQIKQTSEQILLLANKVETIDGTVQTHTAELKVHNEQIASKVTATQVAQQIADTEIGMTNMLLNSGMLFDTAEWRDWGNSTSATRNRLKVEGLSGLEFGFEISKTEGGQYGYAQDNIVVLPDTEYTISVMAKAEKGTVTATIQKGNGSDDAWVPTRKEVGTKWTRISYTWTTSSKTEKTNYYIGFDGADKGKVILAGMKMEQGIKATAWSPNPKDVKTEIQDEIVKLPIGGTNYIAFSSGSNEYPRLMIKNTGYYRLSRSKAEFEDGRIAVTPTTADSALYDIGTTDTAISGVGLQYYGIDPSYTEGYLTFSTDLQSIGGSARIVIYTLTSGAWVPNYSDYVKDANGIKRAVAIAKFDSRTTGFICRIEVSAGTKKAYFGRAQLETGMKSTSWKKSHFDLENDINNVVAGVDVNQAWSWSADGKDRFTRTYPNENLFVSTRYEKTASREFVNDVRWDMAPMIDKYGLDQWYTISFDIKSKVAGNVNVYAQNGSGTKYSIGTKGVQVTSEYQRFSTTFKPTKSSDTETRALLAFYGTYDTGRIPVVRNVKFELGNKETLDTPSPKEDYENAYPKYIGTSTKDSDNYKDYLWTMDAKFVDVDKQQQLNGKEGSIMKQPNAPQNPAVGLIWIDTSGVPNVGKRWTGTEWVKMSPTEAGEIGAFSDTDGRDLIDRMSSAEQVITAESITNTVLQSEDFGSLFNSKANSEDLLDLATIDQLNNQYSAFEAMLKQEVGDSYDTLFKMYSELEQTVSKFDFKIQQAGGINMLRNSLGFSGLDFWGDTSDNAVNTFSTKSTVSQLQNLQDFKRSGYDIYAVGNNTIKGAFRLNNVISSNGLWTLSFRAKGTQSAPIRFKLEFCDKLVQEVTVNSKKDNEWEYMSFTFNVTNYTSSTFHFIDFEQLAWAYFYFTDIKVEKGDLATPWSPAPVDSHSYASNIETTQDNALANLGFGSGFVHKAGGTRIIQNVTLPAKGVYTMSLFMKKSTSSGTHGGAGIEVFSNGKRLAFIGAEEGIAVNEYTQYQYTFTADDLDVSIHMVSWGNINTTVTMSGLMFNIGELALTWQPYPTEIYNTNVLIDINGITVKNNQTKGYTLITPTEFSGYAQVGSEMKRIFTLNGKTTEVEEIKIRSKIQMGTITVLPINSGKNKGWAFIG